MSVILTTLLPLLLKYLLPLISAWFAARGHVSLSNGAVGSDPGVVDQQLKELYAAWSGIAALGIGSGEGISYWARRSAAGAISAEQFKKIIELIFQLLQMFLTPQQSAQLNSAIATAFPDEARHLGVRR